MTLAVADTSTGPQGQAERWDKELIALLALVTLADVASAMLHWNRYADKRFRGLLAAKTTATTGLWFLPDTQRFHVGNREISPDTIRLAVASASLSMQDAASASAALMLAGILDIPTWQTSHAVFVKLTAIAMAAAGKGGTGQLTGDDLQAITETLEFQYERLARFALQIERNIATGIESRAAAYVRSAGMLYEQMREVAHEAAGFDLYRNVLAPADHCIAKPGSVLMDCPSVTREGFAKIGTLPAIGGRVCLWNCLCHWEFSRSNNGRRQSE